MTQAAVETDLQLEVVVDRKELLRGLSTVIDIVERKTTIPILTNLLMRATPDGFMTLTATDLDQSIRTCIPAQTRCEGLLTVPARKFYEYVKLLSDDSIKLLQTENCWLQIKCGRSRTKMIGLAADHFPQIPTADGPFTSLDATMFRSLIKFAQPCISNEESRYTLNGALLEIEGSLVAMVATDGHRLAKVRGPRDSAASEEPGKFIIPNAALKELSKLLADAKTLEFFDDGKTLFFRIGETLLTSRKISGSFPNYQAVIPAAQKNAIVLDAKTVAAIIGRCSVFSSPATGALAIRLTEKEMHLSAACADLGESEEPLDIFGGPERELTIGMNGDYLSDLFKSVDGNIEFHVKDEKAPALFIWRGDDSITLEHVIMPMQLGAKK